MDNLKRFTEKPSRTMTALEAVALKKISLRQFRRYVAAGTIKPVGVLYGRESDWKELHIYNRSDVEAIWTRCYWRK